MDLKKEKVVSKGEPFVWLSSMGLALGLVMIFCMLLLIFVKGLDVFWPKRVVAITVAEGKDIDSLKQAFGELPEGTSRVFGGEVVTKRKQMGRHIDEETGKVAPAKEEWQLFVGNRDIYGFSFVYIPKDQVAELSMPKDVMRVERLEYGDMLGFPKALVKRKAVLSRDATTGKLTSTFEDVERLEASDPAFDTAFEVATQEVQSRRDEMHKIERGRIGKINTQMDRLTIKLGVLDREEAAGKTVDPAAKEKIKTQIDELQERYNVLKQEVDELRVLQQQDRLEYTLLSGQDSMMPVGNIVSFYRPNQLGTLARLKQFVVSLWRFITEEPREANTEGGIFPAIFGTFVMTLIMSVMVTPFGVIAAIYLREYAKQGPVVRMVRIAINNLAGVPSIVFGVFGLGFFVYIMGGTVDSIFFSDALPRPTFGTGGVLWASLTLALLTVPVVIVASEEALASVPRGAREGSLACGASQWQTIQRVILPAAAPGILTGVILAMARGAGEVAPLMLVGVVKMAPSLPINTTYPYFHLEQKFMHLGFHIYDLGFQSPDSEAAKPMVFATTFVLIVLVVMMNIAAIRIRDKLRKKYATGAF